MHFWGFLWMQSLWKLFFYGFSYFFIRECVFAHTLHTALFTISSINYPVWKLGEKIHLLWSRAFFFVCSLRQTKLEFMQNSYWSRKYGISSVKMTTLLRSNKQWSWNYSLWSFQLYWQQIPSCTFWQMDCHTIPVKGLPWYRCSKFFDYAWMKVKYSKCWLLRLSGLFLIQMTYIAAAPFISQVCWPL